MMPLVELNDLLDRLAGDIEPADEQRAETLLLDASAAVRNYTRQDFTPATSTTRSRPVGGKVRLQQRPVISVDSVAVFGVDFASAVPVHGWVWDGGTEVWLDERGIVANASEAVLEMWQHRTPLVEVTYTHGYSVVPADVVAVVCGMALRGLNVGALAGGLVKQQTVGPFGVTYDTSIQGFAAMTQHEQRVLDRYRRRTRTVELR